MKRLTRAQAAKITAIPVLGQVWGVDDAVLLTGYCRGTILGSIRTGEIEAIECVYFRSRPDGQILRRRYYGIPDWSLNAWLERKILRRRADGNWAQKPGRKAALHR